MRLVLRLYRILTLLRAPRSMIAVDERTPLTAPCRGTGVGGQPASASAGKLGEGYSAGQAIWTAGLATCLALVLVALLGVFFGRAAAPVYCAPARHPPLSFAVRSLHSIISSGWGCRCASVAPIDVFTNRCTGSSRPRQCLSVSSGCYSASLVWQRLPWTALRHIVLRHRALVVNHSSPPSGDAAARPSLSEMWCTKHKSESLDS